MYFSIFIPCPIFATPGMDTGNLPEIETFLILHSNMHFASIDYLYNHKDIQEFLENFE